MHTIVFKGEDSSGCYPTSKQADVKTETCNGTNEQLYTHNYIAGQSYINTKTLYKHSDGRTVLVRGCAPAPELGTFNHKSEFCGYQYNDAALQATVKTRLYFKPGGSTVVYLSQCKKSLNPITYAYLKDKTVIINANKPVDKNCRDPWVLGHYRTNPLDYYEDMYRIYQRPDKTLYSKYIMHLKCIYKISCNSTGNTLDNFYYYNCNTEQVPYSLPEIYGHQNYGGSRLTKTPWKPKGWPSPYDGQETTVE